MIAILLKPAPALLCAAWAARAASRPSARYRWLFVAALLSGALGDGLLAGGLFVPGLIAFLIGHVFYATAFASEGARPRAVSLAGPLLFGAIVIAALWPGLGEMRAPVLCYVLVIAIMAGLAIDLRRRSRDRTAARAAAGACFFLISDTFVGLDRFRSPLGPPLIALLVFSTYYVAQFLLASSVGKADREPATTRDDDSAREPSSTCASDPT
jgi:alkylglycerol monooxygenase